MKKIAVKITIADGDEVEIFETSLSDRKYSDIRVLGYCVGRSISKICDFLTGDRDGVSTEVLVLSHALEDLLTDYPIELELSDVVSRIVDYKTPLPQEEDDVQYPTPTPNGPDSGAPGKPAPDGTTGTCRDGSHDGTPGNSEG